MEKKIDMFTFATGIVVGFFAAKSYFKKKYAPKEETMADVIQEGIEVLEAELAKNESPKDDIVTEAVQISKDTYDSDELGYRKVCITVKPFDPLDIRTYGEWYNYLPRSVSLELVASRIESKRKRCFYIEDPRMRVRYHIRLCAEANEKENAERVMSLMAELICPYEVEPEVYSCDATVK